MLSLPYKLRNTYPPESGLWLMPFILRHYSALLYPLSPSNIAFSSRRHSNFKFSSETTNQRQRFNLAYTFHTITNNSDKAGIPLSFTLHINNRTNPEVRESFTFKPSKSTNTYENYGEIYKKIAAFKGTEPLLLLHGLLGAKRNFNSFARLLKADFVIAIDLRNHGDSTHSGGTSLAHMATDIIKFLDTFGIDSCALIGHSLGGKVAMMTALEYPDRVSQLVSLDMPNIAFSKDSSKNARYVSNVVTCAYSLFDKGIKFSTRNHIKEHIKHLVPNITPEMLSFLLQNATQDLDGNWSWTINIEAIYKSLENDLFDWPITDLFFGKPSLFISGGNSNYISPQHKPHILSQFPKAHFASIPEAGHWIHSEKPHETASAINKFLSPQ